MNLPTVIIPFILIFLQSFHFSTCRRRRSQDMPRKQYIFSLRQDDLYDKERMFEGRNYHLSKEEHVVDHYLQYLKWKVLQETAHSGNFPPSTPVEKMMEEIKASEIYKILKIMPKGGNLHTHENHQLGKKKLLELFMASNISKHLYVHSAGSSHEWKLEVHENDPDKEELINVLDNQGDPQYSIEHLASRQTMIGAMNEEEPMPPSDSTKRWQLANKVFAGGSSSLVVNEEMKRNYLKAMYEQGLSEGIYYFETRKSFSRMERDIELTKDLVEEFRQEHPEFVGHQRIYYSKRTDKHETVAKHLMELHAMMKVHPDHVVGYDIVGEEDWGATNLHHIDEFLKYIDIRDVAGNVTSHIPWFLHTAESNWIEDVHIPLVNSEIDVLPRSTNLYSALLMGSQRIGHGIGFWKHPYLMELLKKNRIPVEVCVVSNQLLGYTHDLRQHPAQLFHKMGIPIILSPDDPGLFGYDEVTLDWYEAFMGWKGLNLGDLRQFGINSIRHSSLTEKDKHHVIDGILKNEWTKYISNIYNKACMESPPFVEPKFKKMFPLHGSFAKISNVHIFGFQFESAICRRIVCRFGNSSSEILTKGIYKSNQHIVCKTPTIDSMGDKSILLFPVYVTWSKDTLIHHEVNHADHHDSVYHHWMETGFEFEFHDKIYDESVDVVSNASSFIRFSVLLFILQLFVFFEF